MFLNVLEFQLEAGVVVWQMRCNTGLDGKRKDTTTVKLTVAGCVRRISG
jgi:hypothetical protein